MAGDYNYNFPIPLVSQQAPADSYDPQQAIQVIRWLLNGEYSQFIYSAAAATKVPAGFIIGIIVRETGGYYPNTDLMISQVTDPSSDDSTGLMQVAPVTFYEVIVKELSTGRLGTEEKQIINQYLPQLNILSAASLPANPSSALKSQIQKALLNPEFNIWAGAIRLGYLFDKNIERATGNVRLDKVIHMYNAGDYRVGINDKYSVSIKPLWDILSVTQLYLHFLPVTKIYVETILGPNGVLDLMINQHVQ